MSETKRLVETTKIYEVINEINEKSGKEKQGGARPPHWEMVFWWTRKPLIGARAVIVASLLPELVDVKDFKRIIRLDAKTPHREPVQIPENLEGYFKGIKLLDPFAGFGSIPLEAMRMGLDVTAVELLPTAYIFLKAVLEYPAKFGKERVEVIKNGKRVTMSRLAYDVERWGKWVTEKLKEDEDIRKLYDEDVAVYIGSWEVRCPHCDKWTPIVGNWWLARVKDNKGYKRLAYMEPVKQGDRIEIRVVDVNKEVGNVQTAKVDTKSGVIEVKGRKFVVPKPNKEPKKEEAKCLHCGNAIKYVDESGAHYASRSGRKGLEWSVKWALKKYHEGDERFARQRLLVKVKVVGGDLVFEPCTDEDQEKLEKAKEKVRGLIEAGDVDIPTEPLAPYGLADIGANLKPLGYGMTEWYKLFNSRQLLILVKLVKLIREVGKKVEEEKIKEGWSEDNAFAYAEAIATYLAIALVRYVDYDAITSAYHPSNPFGMDVRSNLSFRGIAMVWNWADLNPLIVSRGLLRTTGSWRGSLENVTKSLSYLTSAIHPPQQKLTSEETLANVNVIIDDATTLSKVNEQFDVIVTDPPYAYDVAYSELSDFYYVWLKRALSDSDGKKLIPRFHKDAFFKKVGAKLVEIKTQWQEFAKREISENPGRFLDAENRNEIARKHFEELFSQALISIKEHLKENGIIALYYAHTSFEAWANLIDAVRKAGLQIVNTFPLTTESQQSIVKRGKLSLDTSIVVVCRILTEKKEAMLMDILPELERETRRYAEFLVSRNFVGADILVGTMTGALKIITKYSKILTPAGEIPTAKLLEEYVYPYVGQAIAYAYSRKSNVSPIQDSNALLYTLAKVLFGSNGIKARKMGSGEIVLLCLSTKVEKAKALQFFDRNREEYTLKEIKTTNPKEIRKFLMSKKISPDSPIVKNPVDFLHLMCYYSLLMTPNELREKFNELSYKYPKEADEAVKMAYVLFTLRDAEGELCRRFLNALGLVR